MGHLHALLIPLQHVVLLLVELAQALHDLVLAWIVDLFQSLLHLGFKLDVFHINLLNPLVFGVNQELEVLAFLLQLPERSLPLDVTRVPLLLGLDDLVMQLVVLLRQFFIFFLERHHCLLVQRLVMLDHEQLILQFLVALSCLKKVVQQSLHEVARFHVYSINDHKVYLLNGKQ